MAGAALELAIMAAHLNTPRPESSQVRRFIAMSKVKLIVCEGYGSEQRPYKSAEGKVIDLDVRVPDTHDILAVVRSDFDVQEDGSKQSSNTIEPIVRPEHINNLIGNLLTLLDSMFSDPKQ